MINVVGLILTPYRLSIEHLIQKLIGPCGTSREIMAPVLAPAPSWGVERA
jgi:hypothetical protein